MALEAGNEVESLHKTVYQKEGSEISLMDRIPSERDESEAVLNRLMLDQLLTELEDRERRLIELRYFHDKTQMQVAELLEMNQVQVSPWIKKKKTGNGNSERKCFYEESRPDYHCPCIGGGGCHCILPAAGQRAEAAN